MNEFLKEVKEKSLIQEKIRTFDKIIEIYEKAGTDSGQPLNWSYEIGVICMDWIAEYNRKK